MKRSLVFAAMLAMVSAPAFAAKNSQTLSVPTAVKAGSTELAPGDYDVTWTSPGPNVQVTFSRNRKVLATVPAELVVETNRYEGMDTKAQGGVQVLQSIHMKNLSLKLEGPPSSSTK